MAAVPVDGGRRRRGTWNKLIQGSIDAGLALQVVGPRPGGCWGCGRGCGVTARSAKPPSSWHDTSPIRTASEILRVFSMAQERAGQRSSEDFQRYSSSLACRRFVPGLRGVERREAG